MVDSTQLAAELAKCGNALIALASAMTGQKPEAAEPAAQPKPATQPESIPLEKVRAVLADKSRLGHTAEVKALLQKLWRKRRHYDEAACTADGERE